MKSLFYSCSVFVAATTTVFGAATLTPLTSFSNDGWLSPAEYSYGDSLTRGMAYNPVSNNLLLATRNGGNGVKVLNSTTGAETGTMDVTGIAGGTFPINMINVGADGAVYAANLSTSAASNFKVYRWADESAAPTVAYDALSGLARTGDSFAVFGSGAGTRMVAAGSNAVEASNFVSLTSADGLTFTSTVNLSVAGTSTANNDYRLGLTFIDSDTIIGTQGTNGRVTSFGGVLEDTIPLSLNQRLLDYAVISGVPTLAVADSATSLVSVYDITIPSAPVLMASGTTTSGTLLANGNGVGSVQWGPINGDSATLYAMATNQGIQAFTFTVPEPTTAAFALLGLLGIFRRRR
jgi:uncharacterized protein (TIGR03382 family)